MSATLEAAGPLVERAVLAAITARLRPVLGDRFSLAHGEAGYALGVRPQGGPSLRIGGVRLTDGLSAHLVLEDLAGSGAATALFEGFPIALTRLEAALENGSLAYAAIAGTMALPFFSDEARPATVAVEVSLREDGEFVLSLAPGEGADGTLRLRCPILPGADGPAIVLHLASLQVARGAEGEVRLVLGGAMEVEGFGLDWPRFELRALRLDSRGGVEIDGGWMRLPESLALDFHGFRVDLDAIGFGTDEHGRWIGLDGTVNLIEGVPLGGSVRGLRIRLSPPPGVPALSFDGVSVDFEIPGAIRFAGEVAHLRATSQEGLGAITLPVSPANPVDLFLGKVRCEVLAVPGMEVDADFAVGTIGGASVFFLSLGAEFGAGLPIFANVSLYGLRGMVASNLQPEPGNWWEWYKHPSEGTATRLDAPPDFTATDVSKWIAWPRKGAFAVGAGATIGTSVDNGFTASAAITLVLTLPGPVVQLFGKANIVSRRVGGAEAEGTFDAFAGYDAGASTFDLAIHAHYSVPLVLDIEAEANLHVGPEGWHFALGLPPADKRVRARILDLFETNAYFVASDRGLVTGTWSGYRRSWDIGVASLSIDVFSATLLAVQWSPVQVGGGLQWHGEIVLEAFGFEVGLGLNALIEACAPDPFWVHGEFSVKLDLPWPFDDVDVTIEVEWGGASDTVPPAPLPLGRVEATMADHHGAGDRFPLLAHAPVPAGQAVPQSDLVGRYDDADRPGLLTRTVVPRKDPGAADPLAPGNPVAAYAVLVPQDGHFTVTFAQPTRDATGGAAPGFLAAVTDEALLRSDHAAVGIPSHLPADDLSDLNPDPPAVSWTYRHTLREVTLLRRAGKKWEAVARAPRAAGDAALDLPGVWLPPAETPGPQGRARPNTALKLVPCTLRKEPPVALAWGGAGRDMPSPFADRGLRLEHDATLAMREEEGGLLLRRARVGSRRRFSVVFPDRVQLVRLRAVVTEQTGEMPISLPGTWRTDTGAVLTLTASPLADGLYELSAMDGEVCTSPLMRRLRIDLPDAPAPLRITELAWKHPDVRMPILPVAPAFYALRTVVQVEAARVGPGEPAWKTAKGGEAVTQFAFLQTASGPGTAGPTVPPVGNPPLAALPVPPPAPALAAAAEAIPALGLTPDTAFPRGGRLNDLRTYARGTWPADGEATAYHGHDLTVEFNETYVPHFYGALGTGVPLHLRVTDRNGRHLAVETVRGTSAGVPALSAAVGRVLEPPLPAFLPGDWQPIDAAAEDGGALVPDAEGRLVLILPRPDGTIRWLRQSAALRWDGPSGTIAPPPAAAGTPPDTRRPVAAGREADGRVLLLAAADDGKVWRLRQDGPAGGWGAWKDLGGGPAASLLLVADGAGAPVGFARRADGTLWVAAPLASNPGWTRLTGGAVPALDGPIAAAVDGSGRLTLLARRAADRVPHARTRDAAGAWGGWESLGGPAVGPLLAAVAQSNGVLCLFAVREDGALWRLRRDGTGGAWGAWQRQNGPAGRCLAVGRRGDGGLDLLSRTPSGELIHFRERTPDDARTLVGTPFEAWRGGAALLAPRGDGRLEAVSADPHGRLFSLVQTILGGLWERSQTLPQRRLGRTVRDRWPTALRPRTRYTLDVVPYALGGRTVFLDRLLQAGTVEAADAAMRAWHRHEDALPSLLRVGFATSRWADFTAQMRGAAEAVAARRMRRYPAGRQLRSWMEEAGAPAAAFEAAHSAHAARRLALATGVDAFEPLADDLQPDPAAAALAGERGLLRHQAEAAWSWAALSSAAAALHALLAAQIARPDLTEAPPPEVTELSLLMAPDGNVGGLYLAGPEPLPWRRIWDSLVFRPLAKGADVPGRALWNGDGTRAFILAPRKEAGQFELRLTFEGHMGAELPCITREGRPVVETVGIRPVPLNAPHGQGG